jgi:putative transposase
MWCSYRNTIPKYRRKALYGSLRKRLGSVFREWAQQKECTIEEGHLMADHVPMLLVIPPKYSVSQVLGYLKRKSAIHIARACGRKRRNFVGQHFWARGYWVSTVGHNEAAVRLYIQEQEQEDQSLDPSGLFEGEGRFERFIISSLWLFRRLITIK